MAPGVKNHCGIAVLSGVGTRLFGSTAGTAVLRGECDSRIGAFCYDDVGNDCVVLVSFVGGLVGALGWFGWGFWSDGRVAKQAWGVFG